MKTTRIMCLCTVGAISLMQASMACAQADAATTTPPPASPSTDATQAVNVGDIVVTGYRASAARAVSVKREAASVVEAVTSQDLGRFSDVNIADVLQRVPGVQIERNDSGTAGDRASIRGLGPGYTQVTINGRVPLTGGNEGINSLRQVNLDVLPTEVISGMLVYKTPTADLVESGIAGEIDVQTLKPLDYRAPGGGASFGSLTVRADYDDQTENFIPRISGVIGAKLLDETLGVYLAGLWSRGDTSSSELFSRFATRDLSFDDNADGRVDRVERGVLVPSRITASKNDGEINRLAFSSGLQFKPNDRWEINVEGTYSKYLNQQYRPTNDLQFNSANSVYDGVALPGGYTVRDGRLLALDTSKLVYAGGVGPGVTLDPQPLKLFNDQYATILGGNVKYTGDRIRASVDYGYSEGRYDQDLRLFFGGTSAPNRNVQYDGVPMVPTITGLTNVVTPPGGVFNGFFGRKYFNRSHAHALRGDVAYDLTPDVVLKGGVRYQDTTIRLRSTSLFVPAPDASTGFTTAISQQMPSVVFNGQGADFLSRFNFGVPIPFLDYQAAANLVPALRDAAIDKEDASFAVTAHEKTTALYVQADGNGAWGSMPVKGNVGVRAVYTDLTSQSAQSTTVLNGLNATLSQTLTPTSDTNRYWEFLPSANLDLNPREPLHVRLGVSRVMSRPEYEDTAPRNAVSYYDPNDPRVDPSQRGSATLGNTKLKPLTAWQFDLTLEYYTSGGGALYLGGFHKKVDDFILRTVTLNTTIPAQGATRLDVTQPVNASDGRVYGAEVGLNQPFSFLPAPWDGFGMEANYTFIDSKITVDNAASTTSYGFPGASKHNANAVAYYEKGPFAARVAYAYRSSYFQALGGGNDRAAQPTFTKGYGQLNASLSYRPVENLELSITGTNLTRADRRDYIVDPDMFRSFIQRSRTIAFAVRGFF
ncbi:TonB-dependent receptor [Brevundimonas sp. SORGH_AS_0993]|uniref:TonB-dependent receptor n=1 Tax=Brevundimonas sp. SORGH_AS_0993 TaxID=3041794 RepID=UPI00277D9E4E|nr:TonB-dependent receptor [Brevundimonas sp. SORGH_AS_0993]MDQ1155165.1 iron complex outermembrane receptor protein [Brevundimonas sp. SORGH_AS_0993]